VTVGDLCEVYIPPHMMDRYTKYAGLWESPEGMLRGKLMPGALVVVVDECEVIRDDMRMAMVVASRGLVGWVDVLLLRVLWRETS